MIFISAVTVYKVSYKFLKKYNTIKQPIENTKIPIFNIITFRQGIVNIFNVTYVIFFGYN